MHFLYSVITTKTIVDPGFFSAKYSMDWTTSTEEARFIRNKERGINDAIAYFQGIICFHGSFRSILWSLKSFLFNGSSWSSNTFSFFVSQVKGYNNWQTTRSTISSSPECITAVFVQRIVAAFVVDTNKEIYNAWSPFPFQLIECLSWPGLVMGLWYFGVRSRLHSKCD